ncbi:hypothetical protein D3C77_749600 [compost metagenome]
MASAVAGKVRMLSNTTAKRGTTKNSMNSKMPKPTAITTSGYTSAPTTFLRMFSMRVS